jgi:hypothetical protein
VFRSAFGGRERAVEQVRVLRKSVFGKWEGDTAWKREVVGVDGKSGVDEEKHC